MLSDVFVRLRAYHKILSEHCQNRSGRLLCGNGDPSPRGVELKNLTRNLPNYGAQYFEDEEGDSSATGSSFGEGFLVDDEDSFSHEENDDAEFSNGSENA